MALAGAVVLFLQGYVLQVFTVSTPSMSPTLLPEDSVLVDRLAYDLRSPRRGDLIVFRYAQADGRDFLKRVVGIPGDTVEEHNGQFWVNGLRLAWPGADAHESAANAPLSMTPFRVPGGQLFVLGDNPVASLDSRFWGTVNIHEVVGTAVFICWSRGADWWRVRWDRIGRWLP